MMRTDKALHMLRIFAKLKEKERIILGLAYYEELTTAEIANIMGISENAVKASLKWARRRFFRLAGLKVQA